MSLKSPTYSSYLISLLFVALYFLLPFNDFPYLKNLNLPLLKSILLVSA